jgi:hypothetical protein
VSDPVLIGSSVVRIDVLVRIGDHLLAATDDPVFLGIRGPTGREFRLLMAHGKSLRRKSEDRFTLTAASDGEANVAHPELNDPTRPLLDASGIESVYLRKGVEPIPNVRAVGELDDRLEVAHAEVVLHTYGGHRLRFAREGPVWLGLTAGMSMDLARLDEDR